MYKWQFVACPALSWILLVDEWSLDFTILFTCRIHIFVSFQSFLSDYQFCVSPNFIFEESSFGVGSRFVLKWREVIQFHIFTKMNILLQVSCDYILLFIFIDDVVFFSAIVRTFVISSVDVFSSSVFALLLSLFSFPFTRVWFFYSTKWKWFCFDVA